MTIFPNGQGFTNQGTLHAMGTGGMSIPGDPVTTSGTVLVDAGSSLSRTGAYTQTAGTTTVNGTLSATGPVDIQGGALQGTGTVSANVSNAGQVNPGTSPGLLTVNGTYTQTSAGALNIEIGGPNVGTDYDRLVSVRRRCQDPCGDHPPHAAHHRRLTIGPTGWDCGGDRAVRRPDFGGRCAGPRCAGLRQL